MLRLYRHGRRRRNVRHARSASLCFEELQSRLVLSAAGFAGNDCQPDLDLSGLPSQVVLLGDTLTIDLLAAGATANDDDLTDAPTNDVLRFQLDPDVGTDTPIGAAISDAGVLTWTPTADQLGDQSIMILLLDAGSPVLADAERLIVRVTDTPEPNQFPPSVDLNGDAAGADFAAIFSEGDGPTVIVDPGLTVTDLDSSVLNLATVTIQNAPDGADEVLSVDTTGTTIVSSYDSVSGELTLSGSDDSPAEFQQVLRTLTYQNLADEPTSGDRSVVVTVSDDDLTSDPATSTVSVVTVNDAPVVDLNGDDAGDGFQTSFTSSSGEVSIVGVTEPNALTITDAENSTINSATARLLNVSDVGREFLDVSVTGTSINKLFDVTNGVLELTGSSSVADYQAILRTLTYNNSATTVTAGNRVVEVTVTDGLVSNAALATIDVQQSPANQMPELAAIADRFVTANQPMEVSVTATDPDSSDTLTLELETDIVLSTSATIDQTSNTTAVVRWIPTEEDGVGPFTFRVIATDDGIPTLKDEEEFLVSVRFSPSVDLNGDAAGADFAAIFSEGDDPMAIVDPGLSVTDLDSGVLDLATATIQNIADGANEVLSVDTTGTTIVSSYDSVSGELTLSGSDDSPAEFQQVLRTLTYQNLAGEPTPGDRSVVVTVSDDDLTSDPVTSTVSVLAVNDAPAIDLNGDDEGIDNTAAAPFVEDGVAVNLTTDVLTVTDADSAELTGATIAITNLADGAAEVLNVEVEGTDVAKQYDGTLGVLTLEGTANLATYETILETLTYENTSDDPTATDRSLEVRINDGTDESAVATVTVPISAVNDPPLLNLNHSGSFGVVGPSRIPIARQITVTDVDSPMLEGAAIVLNDRLDGSDERLHINIDDTEIDIFLNDAIAGTLALVGTDTVENYQKVLQTLEYSNNAANQTPGDRRVEIKVTDGPLDSNTTVTTVIVRSPPDGNDVLSEAETANLDVGQTVPHPGEQLESGGDVDFFSVDVLAGQTLIADATAEFLPAVRIFDVNGMQVSDATAITSTAFVAADADATYFVGVSADDNTTYNPAIASGRSGSATGIYDLTLSLFESGSGNETLFLATPITVGSDLPLDVFDRIDPGSDVDFFAVTLNADEVLQVDVILPPDAGIFVRIFNAQGNDIGIDEVASSSVTASLDSAGTVYVGVSSIELFDYHPLNPAGRSGTSVTDYRISLQRGMSALAAPLVDAVLADEEEMAGAGTHHFE